MKGKAMLAIGEKHMQTNSRDGPVKSAGRETDTERLGGGRKRQDGRTETDTEIMWEEVEEGGRKRI